MTERKLERNEDKEGKFINTRERKKSSELHKKAGLKQI